MNDGGQFKEDQVKPEATGETNIYGLLATSEQETACGLTIVENVIGIPDSGYFTPRAAKKALRGKIGDKYVEDRHYIAIQTDALFGFLANRIRTINGLAGTKDKFDPNLPTTAINSIADICMILYSLDLESLIAKNELRRNTKFHERTHFRQNNDRVYPQFPADVCYDDLYGLIRTATNGASKTGLNVLPQEAMLAVQDYIFYTELEAYGGSLALLLANEEKPDLHSANYYAFCALALSSFLKAVPEDDLLTIVENTQKLANMQEITHYGVFVDKSLGMYPKRLARIAAITGNLKLLEQSRTTGNTVDLVNKITIEMQSKLEHHKFYSGSILGPKEQEAIFFVQTRQGVLSSTKRILEIPT